MDIIPLKARVSAWTSSSVLPFTAADIIDADGSAAADPEVKLGDLEALRGVVKFPVRIKCATLSWNTLAQALDSA